MGRMLWSSGKWGREPLFGSRCVGGWRTGWGSGAVSHSAGPPVCPEECACGGYASWRRCATRPDDVRGSGRSDMEALPPPGLGLAEATLARALVGLGGTGVDDLTHGCQLSSAEVEGGLVGL